MKKIIFALLILSAFGINAQEKSIVVSQINDSVYKLYINDYSYMYAFTGEDGTLLIDTGYGPDEKMVKEELGKLNGENVRYIINTHSNGDHVAGNNLFENAVIISHTNCRKDLLETPDFPADGLPNLVIEDELTLYFNSEEIQIIPFLGGHTDNDVVVYFVNSQLVFLGDIIVADTFPVVWQDYFENTSVDKLVANLKNIISRFPDDVTFISSHGRDYTKDDMKEYYSMVIETITIVKKAIAEGKTLKQIQQEDVLKDYSFYNSERFKFINADLWIETIFKSRND
ncbi:MBL fold metallo-hydrolase [Bacteroidota bacterium]